MADPTPDPDRKPHKVRGLELRKRIELVRMKLLTGHNRKWVFEMIGEEWGLKPSQRWNYINKAEEEIQEIRAKDAAGWLTEHIAIRRDIRRRASDVNDLRVELAAADSEAKLLGIFREGKPAAGDNHDLLTDAERLVRLADLARLLQSNGAGSGPRPGLAGGKAPEPAR